MAEYNGTIDLISGIRPKNNGTFPLVDAKDVQMPDGKRLSEFKANADIPSFDLAALGLPTPMLNGEAVSVETNTSEILDAVSKGQIKISLPVKLSESIDAITINAISGNAMLAENSAVVTAIIREMSLALIFTINITSTAITVNFTSIRELPEYTANDAKKVLSVSESGSYVGWKEIEIPEMPEVDTSAPIFDLTAMGLPNITMGSKEGVLLEADTTEIMEALSKGEVTFKLIANVGMSLPFVATVNPIFANGQYVCGACLPIMTELDCLVVNVGQGYIMAAAYPMTLGSGTSTTPPTSINLSGLESNGQIVETYSDGSTKTSTIEFDTDGNPTKITDGDGNVTTLTW